MKNKTSEELISDLNGLGEGPLTLGIYCTKCNAQFDLGKEGPAMAWITGATFIEYLKYIQSSKCPKCSPEELNELD